MALSRRRFLTLAATTAVGTGLASTLEAVYVQLASGKALQTAGFGPLVTDPEGVLDLPAGFQYRIFSRVGDRMSDGYPVPGKHDGMAAFAGPNNTTILIRNHELSPINVEPPVIAEADKMYDTLCTGGTTTLIVSSDRTLIKDFVSLAGTSRNCAGGPTPWGSWLSCEETVVTPAQNVPRAATNVNKPHGYVFEVPATATGPVTPVPLKAMGRFYHEAIAVDPRSGIIYLTEDLTDGRFYRFIPAQPGNLQAGGVLEALKIKDWPTLLTHSNFPLKQKFAVEWVRIDDPDPVEDTVRVQAYNKGAQQFTRGEGICYSNGEIYFTCTSGGSKGSGQIWRYLPGSTARDGGSIELFVESPGTEVMDFPDNLVMAPFGDLIICEDGSSGNDLLGITPAGKIYVLGRNALNRSEFAGACFSPDGQTLFVNIQDPGMTLAIWGPWQKKVS
uniref:Phosphatase n=1 Tax=Cyanothece sp. (strain PCC 7425 / ATCC 29141) TaxID=395961 RepID=B8HP91_CYAP4